MEFTRDMKTTLDSILTQADYSGVKIKDAPVTITSEQAFLLRIVDKWVDKQIATGTDFPFLIADVPEYYSMFEMLKNLSKG
jgi:hypothetical protein